MYRRQFSIEIHSKQKFAAEITILRTIWTGADFQFLRQTASPQVTLVSWSLTSLFSTNMAISETKGQGWKVIRTQ